MILFMLLVDRNIAVECGALDSHRIILRPSLPAQMGVACERLCGEVV